MLLWSMTHLLEVYLFFQLLGKVMKEVFKCNSFRQNFLSVHFSEYWAKSILLVLLTTLSNKSKLRVSGSFAFFQELFNSLIGWFSHWTVQLFLVNTTWVYMRYVPCPLSLCLLCTAVADEAWLAGRKVMVHDQCHSQEPQLTASIWSSK